MPTVRGQSISCFWIHFGSKLGENPTLTTSPKKVKKFKLYAFSGRTGLGGILGNRHANRHLCDYLDDRADRQNEYSGGDYLAAVLGLAVGRFGHAARDSDHRHPQSRVPACGTIATRGGVAGGVEETVRYDFGARQTSGCVSGYFKILLPAAQFMHHLPCHPPAPQPFPGIPGLSATIKTTTPAIHSGWRPI